MKQKAINLLAEFIATCGEGVVCRNQWLYGSDMEIYVRRSVPRMINDKKVQCLDIANILVYKRGEGQFTKFLNEAHQINPWGGTFIENVHDSRFANFFVKQGFAPYHCQCAIIS